MANSSTDELCNAEHHLELALGRHRTFPELTPAQLRRVRRAHAELVQVLTERCGPVEHTRGLARLIPFRPR